MDTVLPTVTQLAGLPTGACMQCLPIDMFFMYELEEREGDEGSVLCMKNTAQSTIFNSITIFNSDFPETSGPSKKIWKWKIGYAERIRESNLSLFGVLAHIQHCSITFFSKNILYFACYKCLLLFKLMRNHNTAHPGLCHVKSDKRDCKPRTTGNKSWTQHRGTEHVWAGGAGQGGRVCLMIISRQKNIEYTAWRERWRGAKSTFLSKILPQKPPHTPSTSYIFLSRTNLYLFPALPERFLFFSLWFKKKEIITTKGKG